MLPETSLLHSIDQYPGTSGSRRHGDQLLRDRVPPPHGEPRPEKVACSADVFRIFLSILLISFCVVVSKLITTANKFCLYLAGEVSDLLQNAT